MKIVFCNGESPECSFTSTLPDTGITLQPLSATATYSLTDTLKPDSDAWWYIIPGMRSRHGKKQYSGFVLITKVYFALSSGHLCGAYRLRYLCYSFECVYTLLDFERSAIVFSAL